MKKPDFSSLKEFRAGRALNRVKNAFLEGWYVKGDAKSQDRVRLLTCNYTSNVIANLVGGTFWTGYLLLLNADDAFIGTMTMISTAANMLQFLAPIFLERFQHRKLLLTVLRAVLYLINVVFIGVIPLFPAENQFKLTMLAISVLLVNIINAMISPGLSIWHVQSVPENVRQYFYSIITMTVGAVVALVNLLGGKLLDIMTARDMAFEGLLLIRGVAAVLCVVEIILYLRIREYPYESSGEKFKLKDLFTEPFKHPKYLWTVAVVFLWCFAANVPGSYYTVYLLRNLNVSYSYINLISMLNVPIVLALTPLWRRVLSKHGWFKTLYLSIAVYLVHYVLLMLVTEKTMFVYPIALVLAYVFAIGINLSFTGIPYVNMPESRQTVFIGFYSSVSNLAALLGVTLGKYFVLFTEEWHLNLLGLEIGNKQLLMLVTAVLLALATIGIRFIHKRTPQER